MHRRVILITMLLALPLVQATNSIEASDPVRATAVAVAEANGGFVGLTATVEATALSDGSGQVFVDTRPLAETDMQASARLAAQAAASALGLPFSQYDFLIVFESPSTVVGGPSAGAVMSVAAAVALHNLENPDDPWEVAPHVAMTGTISPDGTVGPVGGIPEKAEGASGAGVDWFLYPAGQERALSRSGTTAQVVDMRSHCEDLEIQCRAVATLADALRWAAEVELVQPPVEQPVTSDYRVELAPSVQEQVDRLQARVQVLEDEVAAAALPPEDEELVEARLEDARQQLGRAGAALGNESYYASATLAFRGSISVGNGEWLLEFFADGRRAEPVAAAVEACDEAVLAAEDTLASRGVTDATDLFSVGAAQVRMQDARALADQAREEYREAVRLADWLGSIFSSAFCIERAGTVIWWADLPLSGGRALLEADVGAIAQTALQRAQEMTAYAEAVLGSAPAARDALQSAYGSREEGRLPAAIVDAVSAEVAASMAVQTGTGLTGIPEPVLEAARDNAARAVAAARADGVEPLLSVSLFELSGIQQEPTEVLGSLWEARSLALLAVEPEPRPVDAEVVARPLTGFSEYQIRVALALGAALGGLVVMAVLSLAGVLRP